MRRTTRSTNWPPDMTLRCPSRPTIPARPTRIGPTSPGRRWRTPGRWTARAEHQSPGQEGVRPGRGGLGAGPAGISPEAVAWLGHRLGLTRGRIVLDVGAGTGKLTRALAPTGARLIAVEPV